MRIPFQDKRLLLGVTGSIAAYKAAALASNLSQAGALVDAILTQAATRFIAPLTFQSVTGRRAYTDEDLWGAEGHVLHVGLAHGADLLVIAPATADILAKLAHGLAGDLLTVTALAVECPLIVAPAMDAGMYAHPATQANLETLRQRGALVIGPTAGHLASGLTGLGRLVEPEELMGHIRLELARGGPLDGRKVLITAGGTQEPIDPVRTLTNRSSGKQGYALAQAALDLGAQVVLVSAPTALPLAVGLQHVGVETATEMLEATLAHLPGADALLMAAAVADFRPVSHSKQKLKRRDGAPQLQLEPTPDILAAVIRHRGESGFPRVAVGFAAESHDLAEDARAKLREKGLELVAANDISASDAGFAVDTNRITLFHADGRVEPLPLMSKAEVAWEILQRVVTLLNE